MIKVNYILFVGFVLIASLIQENAGQLDGDEYEYMNNHHGGYMPSMCLLILIFYKLFYQKLNLLDLMETTGHHEYDADIPMLYNKHQGGGGHHQHGGGGHHMPSMEFN